MKKKPQITCNGCTRNFYIPFSVYSDAMSYIIHEKLHNKFTYMDQIILLANAYLKYYDKLRKSKF